MYDICGGRWNKTDAEPPRTTLRIAPEGLGGLSLTDLPGVDAWLKSGAFALA